MSTLEMYRGDTQAYSLRITKDEDPVNVSGWTFKMTVKESKSDDTAVFAVENSDFTFSDATTGVGIVTIYPEKTSGLTLSRDTVYVFDIEGTETATGAVHTVGEGTIKIKRDVTTGS